MKAPAAAAAGAGAGAAAAAAVAGNADNADEERANEKKRREYSAKQDGEWVEARYHHSRRAGHRCKGILKLPVCTLVTLKRPQQLLVRAAWAPFAAPGVHVEQLRQLHLALVPGDTLAVGQASGGHGGSV